MSVIRLPGDVLRVAFNRDELLSRPRALQPRRMSLGDHEAALPIDPQSLGTWIAVNDCGLILGLLNLNPSSCKTTVEPVSRGRIVPMLVQAMSAIDVVQMSGQVDLHQFLPFRVIAVDHRDLAEICFDGDRVHAQFHSLRNAAMFTSSGLGDHLVEQPRRQLFERMLAEHGATHLTQDLFHDHVWPEQGHLSVHMSRADARTVSKTIVETDDCCAAMSYTDDFLHRERIELPLSQPVMT